MESIYRFTLNPKPEFEEGTYSYRIKDIISEDSIPTHYGMRQRIRILFRLKTDSGWKDYSQILYPNKKPDSYFFKFMSMLADVYDHEEFDLVELIGAKGKLKLKHEEVKGTLYSNIDSFINLQLPKENSES